MTNYPFSIFHSKTDSFVFREIIELFYISGIVHFSAGCSKTPPKLINLKKNTKYFFRFRENGKEKIEIEF